jgi:cyclase
VTKSPASPLRGISSEANMKKDSLRFGAWLRASLLSCTSTSLFFWSAASPAQPKQFDVTKLADGVYAFVWKDVLKNPIEGNSMFIVNQHDVVVVDTAFFEETARVMAAELKKITPLPVRYVINTHWHDDHHGGNAVYKDLWPGAEIISHRDTRTDIIEKTYGTRIKNIARVEEQLKKYERWLVEGKDDEGKAIDDARKKRIVDVTTFYRESNPKLRNLRESPPDITMTDLLVLQRGERRIEIRWLGLGNTRGDVVVFMPKERIVASGDLFVLPIPFAFGSFYEQWAETMGRLDALEADVIMPGHGPIQRDRVALRQIRALLTEFVDEVKKAAAEGLSLEDTRKRVALKDWREKFAGDDTDRQRAFGAFVLDAAMERMYRQAKGEADPPFPLN